FLWDKNHNGDCEFTSVNAGKKELPTPRNLNEFDVFLRHNQSVGILEKVQAKTSTFMNDMVSGVQPFGLPTNFTDYVATKTKKASVALYLRNGVGYVEPDQVRINAQWVSKHKVLISEAYNGGDNYPHQI